MSSNEHKFIARPLAWFESFFFSSHVYTVYSGVYLGKQLSHRYLAGEMRYITTIYPVVQVMANDSFEELSVDELKKIEDELQAELLLQRSQYKAKLAAQVAATKKYQQRKLQDPEYVTATNIKRCMQHRERYQNDPEYREKVKASRRASYQRTKLSKQNTDG